MNLSVWIRGKLINICKILINIYNYRQLFIYFFFFFNLFIIIIFWNSSQEVFSESFEERMTLLEKKVLEQK